ncbi:MAG: CRISPR-associated endonuclease Cas1 [Saprospiraceae bacterium]|nr:CRISPR-associated endonuclease Cas1 [Saprospiraceae bacterium]MCF8249245.1 CRISPR-associated endonuclease Cas1 [Saprospiraceae bacterium]MCF8281187.1 CRISPR-associated endonuclease Cas1 [Bacteroidales bacterium]MCF8311478.1 CRISPR-associated endonuclease Cas1 [Saprospiraceae bacterium]MCF8439864.1 CRISPR-associated endonuclease Cas1 [Saprospiraceae bacterium]
MQLFLDTYGVFLGVRNGAFHVKPRQSEAASFAVREVNAIFLTRGGYVTTDAMVLALEHNIPIVLLDAIGHPVGQLWSGQFGSTSLVRRNQVLFSTHEAGWRWSAGWLWRKVDAQRRLLVGIEKALDVEDEAYHGFQKKLTRAIPVMKHSANCFERWSADMSLGKSAIAATFRGWEGTASRHYFRCLSAALPVEWQFEGRSFRPAKDAFNALLNYLYGILYAQIEVALIKAGIDPSLAILHADQYNRPTMVYDFIEPYRPWADRVAFLLCKNGKLTPTSFEQTEADGVRIGSPEKTVLVKAWFDFVEEKVLFGKNYIKRLAMLDLEAVALAGTLKKFTP